MNYYLYSYINIIFILVFTLPVITQISIDHTSVVSKNGSTSVYPTHYAYGTLGPYTAYNKVWVFYSDGNNAVWKTKDIDEEGNWEYGGYVFNLADARYFNMTFDGEYFHFTRAVNDNLNYLRGQAKPDGSIIFDEEVLAYSDTVWKVYDHTNPEWYPQPRHFAITVDHQKRP